MNLIKLYNHYFDADQISEVIYDSQNNQAAVYFKGQSAPTKFMAEYCTLLITWLNDNSQHLDKKYDKPA